MDGDAADLAQLERARRSLLGLAVGDAFGGTFFWKTDVEKRVRARQLLDQTWTWSDDTAMGKSVVRCLELHQEIVPDTLARLFGEEYFREPTRGYGTMAHTVLHELGQGVPWQQAATEIYNGKGSCGNGAAMRAGPVGAYFSGDIERVIEQARRSAVVTHAHPEGQAGAVAVAAAAAWAAETKVLDGQAMLKWAWSHTPDGLTRSKLRRALEFSLYGTPEEAAALLGSGQKVTSQDTVPFALWCAARHLDSFPEALWAAVAGQGDMDTTCAMVGSIVVLCAREGIPEKWLAQAEPLEENVPLRHDGPLQETVPRQIDEPTQTEPCEITTAWSQWDGLVRAEMLGSDSTAYRRQLFDAAERYDWQGLFGLLARFPEMSPSYQINLVRPDGGSWNTFLHHAVQGNASSEVVKELVARGHLRSIRNADGERPVDLATRLERNHLVPWLEPVVKHSVPEKKLAALETQFHELIRKDSAWRKYGDELRLPTLEVLLEREDLLMTFQIPWKWGGFVYRLHKVPFPNGMWATRDDWVLLVRGFERMGEGSERWYVITDFGSLLMKMDDDDVIFT